MGPTGDIDRDTATLLSIFAKGGTVPPGRWRFKGPLLYPLTPAYIRLEGVTLEYVAPRAGWESGFGICSAGYRLPGKPRSRGVILDFGKTGQLLIPKNGCTAARKGLGITFTDSGRFFCPRVAGPVNPAGPDNSLFAIQVHESSDIRIVGGSATIQSRHEGSDGFHATGTCRRVSVEGLVTLSSDDATSLTHEIAQLQNSVLEDFTFTDCRIDNLTHSAVKGLILPGMGASSAIRRWKYLRCDLKTSMGVYGQGAPVQIDNRGGIIEDVTIEGGRLCHVVPAGGGPSEPLIYLRGVKRFKLEGTAIDYFGRVLVQAVDCPSLVFRPANTKLLFPVGNMSRPMGLVDLTRCSNPYIDTSTLKRSWPTQELVRMGN